jgi:amidophosphoribosyltransferase
MARDSGARRVIFASAAPPVKYPNVYGIDMPTRDELIAYNRTNEEVCREITADALVYQDIEDMRRSISDINPMLKKFEASCFDGEYITGDISRDYLDRIEFARANPKVVMEDAVRTQLNLNLNLAQIE